MSAYLFTHFTGEQYGGERVYFSLSRDGLHWQDLNGGGHILKSDIGSTGVRDPFPVRHPVTGMYYIIATDLWKGSGITWPEAKATGSRDIIVWSSEDLLHWEGPWAVTVGIPEAGCVWAPEAVFDRERGKFFVWFASNVRLPGEAQRRQRIYGTFTEDFRTFSETFLYMEREDSIIDTTLVKEGGRYYRVTKSEVTKTLFLETSDSLYSGFTPVPCPALDGFYGLEGPEFYRLPDGRLCLIADRFAEDLGYLPMVATDLSRGELNILEPGEYDLGSTKKRHGGIIEISDGEYGGLLSMAKPLPSEY